LQTKAFSIYFRVPERGKYALSSGKLDKVDKNDEVSEKSALSPEERYIWADRH